MSISALNFVLKQKMFRSSHKFVLMCMANYADENGNCYPSIDKLCDDTSLNRKTVISAINDLLSSGHLLDTGKRVGRTSQVIIYSILGIPEYSKTHYTYKVSCPDTGLFYIGKRSCAGDPDADTYRGSCKWVFDKIKSGDILVKEVIGIYNSSQEAILAEADLFRKYDNNSLCINLGLPSKHRERNSSKNGTVPKTEQFQNSLQTVPFFPSNSTVFSSEHNIDRARVLTNSNPKKEPPKKDDELILPEWIKKDQWDAFMEVRKLKKAAQTNYAKRCLIKQLERLHKEGHETEKILDNSIINSWKDLYAPKAIQQNNYAIPLSFDEQRKVKNQQVIEEARRRYETNPE